MQITPILIVGIIGILLGWGTYQVLITRAKAKNMQWLAIEGMNSGMVLVNSAGVITEINPAALEMLGLSRRQALGRKVEAVEGLSQFAEGGESRKRAEIHGQWYEFSVSPLNNRNPKSDGRVILIQNVTAIKKAEDIQNEFLKDMRALQEIHLALSEIDDQNTLYTRMIELARSQLKLDRVGLFLLDQEGTQLVGTFGVDDHGIIRDERYYSEKIAEGHWTYEILQAPKRAKIWSEAPIYDNNEIVGTGWKAGTALWNGHKPKGYLICDCLISGRPERPYELELISVLGNIYGHLIEDMYSARKIRLLNQKLEYMAMRDDLTGLHNRRYFMVRINEEFRRSKRYRNPLSLLMLDLDHFKQINDDHGHENGDKALKHLAEIFRKTLRTTDVIARTGGEEFSILAINTGLEDATFLAERLRKTIDEQSHLFPDRGITVSIGVAALDDSIGDVDEILRNADVALYRAKHNGRNRVEVQSANTTESKEK
jgi:diguanylate cyclase (GGDEF)-like protein/PAS domain S-box-containing protein